MKNEQLLTQGKIFEDEILARAKRTAKPAEDMPEPQDHGKNLTSIVGERTRGQLIEIAESDQEALLEYLKTL